MTKYTNKHKHKHKPQVHDNKMFFFCFFFRNANIEVMNRKLQLVVFEGVIPLETGSGAERWVGLAGLALVCSPAPASTGLVTTHHTVPLACTPLQKVTASIETVWVT